jgi:hypothetical protein
LHGEIELFAAQNQVVDDGLNEQVLGIILAGESK